MTGGKRKRSRGTLWRILQKGTIFLVIGYNNRKMNFGGLHNAIPKKEVEKGKR